MAHSTIGRARRHVAGMVLAAALAFAPVPASAGAQVEEEFAAVMIKALQEAVVDRPVPDNYANAPAVRPWIAALDARVAKWIPDGHERRDLLATVHYEAIRAGLPPDLVLGVIHHESGFKKYAISVANARGYMQVMPFWVRVAGHPDHNLFHLRTNLRYGCAILRLYLDLEAGDLYRTLGRYNGSLGRPEYPKAVIAASERYVAPGAQPLRLSTLTVQ